MNAMHTKHISTQTIIQNICEIIFDMFFRSFQMLDILNITADFLIVLFSSFFIILMYYHFEAVNKICERTAVANMVERIFS